MKKVLVCVLMLVLSLSAFGSAQAAPDPVKAPLTDAQVKEVAVARACLAKLKDAVAKTDLTKDATVDIPGCYTLSNSVHLDGESALDASDIGVNGNFCRNATALSKLAVGPVTLWRITTTMRTCWSDTGGSPIVSFQNPPSVTAYSTISYGVTVNERRAEWVTQPTHAQGVSNSTVVQRVAGIEIGRYDWTHYLDAYECGRWVPTVVGGF